MEETLKEKFAGSHKSKYCPNCNDKATRLRKGREAHCEKCNVTWKY